MSYQTGRFRNKTKRDQLFSEDGRSCAYCLISFDKLPECAITVDHIVPRSAGGTNDLYNLISACHSCNSRRRDTPIAEFVGAETLVRLIRDYPRVSRTIIETLTSRVQVSSVRRIA